MYRVAANQSSRALKRWSSQRRLSKVQCSPFRSDNVQKLTQETLSFAAKPITDVLERIDARLANIEQELKNRYVEKTDGTYIKMLPPDEAK